MRGLSVQAQDVEALGQSRLQPVEVDQPRRCYRSLHAARALTLRVGAFSSNLSGCAFSLLRVAWARLKQLLRRIEVCNLTCRSAMLTACASSAAIEAIAAANFRSASMRPPRSVSISERRISSTDRSVVTSSASLAAFSRVPVLCPAGPRRHALDGQEMRRQDQRGTDHEERFRGVAERVGTWGCSGWLRST